MFSILRKAEMPKGYSRPGHGLGRSHGRARFFINRHAPETQNPLTITAEVKVLPVRRPDRIPISPGVIGHRRRYAAARWHSPDIPLPALLSRPVSHPQPSGRNLRLHRIASESGSLFSCRNVYSPNLTVQGVTAGRKDSAGSGVKDLLAVRRPGGIEPLVYDLRDVLSVRIQQKDSPVITLRPESQAGAVRRIYRLCIVRLAVAGQIIEMTLAHALQANVPIVIEPASVDEISGVRRKTGEKFFAFVCGERPGYGMSRRSAGSLRLTHGNLPAEPDGNRDGGRDYQPCDFNQHPPPCANRTIGFGVAGHIG